MRGVQWIKDYEISRSSKWKDESNRGKDEGRRPEVSLNGRMSPNGGKTRAEGPK